MSKSAWGTLGAGAVVLLVAVIIAMLTYPHTPELAEFEPTPAQNGLFRPGGKRCEASELGKLRSPAARQARADACQTITEDYRLRADELLQQKRAADAAHAQVVVEAQALWTAWFQTIGGFVTLAAAIAAAFYARQAAQFTREANVIAHGQQRPWLNIELEPEWAIVSGEKILLAAMFKVTSQGQQVATSVKYGLNYILVPTVHTDDDVARYGRAITAEHDLNAILPNSFHEEQGIWEIPLPFGEAEVNRGISVILGVAIAYDFERGQGKTTRWFWVNPVTYDEDDMFRPEITGLGEPVAREYQELSARPGAYGETY